MRTRETPREGIRAGWPYLVATIDGDAYGLRIDGGPVERGDTRAWAYQRFDAAAAAVQSASAAYAAVSDGEDRTATLDALRAASRASDEVTEAVGGWLVLWAWFDRDRDLDTRARWEAGDYQGIDAREQAGRACVAELTSSGVPWEHVQAIAGGVLDNLLHGSPRGTVVADIRPFSPTGG